MTENKRFKLGRIFYTDENPCLMDNGQPLCEIVANKEEERVLLEVLNEIHEENIELSGKTEQLTKENQRLYEDNIRVKQLITTAFNNERTELGRSVLKQLIEQL